MIECCEKLKRIYAGAQVKDIPELQELLVEESTDYKKWITIFRCKECGQKWEERYQQHGHGETPEVVKID